MNPQTPNQPEETQPFSPTPQPQAQTPATTPLEAAPTPAETSFPPSPVASELSSTSEAPTQQAVEALGSEPVVENSTTTTESAVTNDAFAPQATPDNTPLVASEQPVPTDPVTLVESSAETVSSPAAEQVAPVAAVAPVAEPAKKSSKTVVILLVILIIVVVAAVGAYLFWQSKASAESLDQAGVTTTTSKDNVVTVTAEVK